MLHNILMIPDKSNHITDIFYTNYYCVTCPSRFSDLDVKCSQVADTHLPIDWHFPVRAWILGLAIPLVPLGIIRTLRLLVPFSAIATTFILVGLGCTMSWVLTGASPFAGDSTSVAVPLPDIASRPWIAPVGHMPLFFATVLFAMEGIGTVSIILHHRTVYRYYILLGSAKKQNVN